MNKTYMKFVSALLIFLLVSTLPVQAFASQTTLKEMPLSTGVDYKQYTYSSTNTNSINHLSINLNDEFTKLSMGLPKDFKSKDITTNIATKDSVEGNRVVGAVNAAFFICKKGIHFF